MDGWIIKQSNNNVKGLRHPFVDHLNGESDVCTLSMVLNFSCSIGCFPYMTVYLLFLFQRKLTYRPLLSEPVPAKYKCLMD